MTQSWSNVLKACIAGALTLVGGLLLLGIPGAIVLEGLAALGMIRKMTGDAAWPAAILVTVGGAAMVTVASLAMRSMRPALTGWRHALAAAALALFVTALVTALVVR